MALCSERSSELMSERRVVSTSVIVMLNRYQPTVSAPHFVKRSSSSSDPAQMGTLQSPQELSTASAHSSAGGKSSLPTLARKSSVSHGADTNPFLYRTQ